MRKRLTIGAAFLAFTAIGFLPCQNAPVNTPKQWIAKSDHGQRRTNQDNPNYANNIAKTSVLTSGHPSADADYDDRQNESENLSIQRKIEWFTGVLAAVGVLQGVVLFLTWRTIRRQANLQKFLTKQWVDIENWGVIGADPRQFSDWDTPENESPRKDEELRDFMEINLGFEILNNTPFPLSLRKVVTRSGKGSKWRDPQANEIEANVVLPPSSAGKDNTYGCLVPIALRGDDVELYARTCFGFQVKVDVYFLNAEGDIVSQHFVRVAVGGVRGFSVGKDLEGKPIKKDNSQKPN